MSSLPRIDAELVLFDLDDTLCDSRLAVMRRVRHAFGLAADLTGVAGAIDFDRMVEEASALSASGADYFPELFAQYGIHGEEAVAVAREWIAANRLFGLEYFDDALETLEFVRAVRPDRRIGVITNGPDWIQRPKVDLLGLERRVDFVIISGEFGVHKPDPAIFQEALRLGLADARDAVYIGDSIEADVAGAHASGIISVWMNRFELPWPESERPPQFIATDLADVRSLLS